MGTCTAVQSAACVCDCHDCAQSRGFHLPSARADAASYPRPHGTAGTESTDVLFHSASDARHGADTRHHAQRYDDASSAVRLCWMLCVHADRNELPEHCGRRLCAAIIRHRHGFDDPVHLRGCGKAISRISARTAEHGNFRLGAEKIEKQGIPAGMFFYLETKNPVSAHYGRQNILE